MSWLLGVPLFVCSLLFVAMLLGAFDDDRQDL